MVNYLKKSIPAASVLITAIFTIAPESVFEIIQLFPSLPGEVNIMLNRLIVCILVYILVMLMRAVWFSMCRKVSIKGPNYMISVEYGDILKVKNCKKVISFDECFTTDVGEAPADVKPESICGQYLTAHPIQNMGMLINNSGIKPERSKSEYNGQTRYLPGTILPLGDDLLMAFVTLDKDGLGKFKTYDEYLGCLSHMWKEIDKYYAQKDVCIPILGSSGLTRLPDGSLDQQKLLDVMIESYKLSPYKIESTLRIICKRKDGFSLSKIGQSL